MPYLRPVPATVLAVVAAIGLTGCGKEDPGFTFPDPVTTTTGPTATTSTGSTPGATEGTSPPATPTDAPSTGSPGCPAATAIPDGTWSGPLAVALHGVGGTSQFTDSPATGTLRLTVANGKVTGGAWNLGWNSEGSAKSQGTEAFIKVAGSIRGSVAGSAKKPALAGTWRLDGSAGLVLPEKTQAPVRDSGTEKTTLTIASADCRTASGTLRISFDSKETLATFSGNGSWAGKLS
ncbi:hypothetical protein EFK50_19320 [Nocardioides marmoriginsengisoli]|uniref:Uncharacterized protein n=1 Tax=Nocardioides marmoriginsengisoli TaxID=661483 RepID=A0A3N0CAI7_9ACTN|nr:hypothetical protein [Nocardioides marmoriginsengisoli]RNL60475.1 hypothetical protein EFK50_19320 [Nocardioides marmoriginsengisoli]